MNKLFCGYCASQLFEDDRTCPQCGAPVQNAERKDVIKHFDFEHWYDNIKFLAISGGDLSMKYDIKRQLQIYAIPGEGYPPFVPPYSELNFHIENDHVAEVNKNGWVIPDQRLLRFLGKEENTVIHVNIKNRPEIEDACHLVIYT